MDVVKVDDHWEYAGIKFTSEIDALRTKIADMECTLQVIAMRKWRNGYLVDLVNEVLETGMFNVELTDLNKKEREKLGIINWETGEY